MNGKEDLDSQRTLRPPLLGKQVATLAREEDRVIEDLHLSSRSKAPVTSPALQQTTYYGLLLSAPFRRLSRLWWNTVLFSHLWTPHSTPSQPTHLTSAPNTQTNISPETPSGCIQRGPRRITQHARHSQHTLLRTRDGNRIQARRQHTAKTRQNICTQSYNLHKSRSLGASVKAQSVKDAAIYLQKSPAPLPQ